MSTAPATETIQNTTSTPDRASRPAPRFTAGYVDGLGERVLMFDDATATSLELLRFKREISDSPAFETALHARIEALAAVHHPALGVVKTAERRGATDDLTLVSTPTPGRRLSEILQAARGAAFALDFLNQIGPAVVALQQQGKGVAHGALTVDRVIVGREGRLVLVEQVLGAAISALKLPPSRLRTDLGLAVPDGSDAPAIDQRLDVIQLGFIALTLLLGRRLDPADYPAKVKEHLDSFQKEDAAAAKLRPWLERALQIGDRPFANARTAVDAFNELADGPAQGADSTSRTSGARGAEESASSRTIHVTPSASSADIFPSESETVGALPVEKGSGRKLTLALGVLAALEAVAIAGLLYTRPARSTAGGADTTASPPIALAAAAPMAAETAAPLEVSAQPGTPPPDPAPAVPAALAAAPAPVPKTESEPATAPGARFGGIRIASPIDLQVLEGGRVVGSSAGPIAVNDGPHTFELVNEALGFRFRQTVQVKPGQMTTVNISVPNGRISINAAPWAEVWIDGTAAGQTPLANLSLTIGQHEIVFRHPQFSEQKQTVTVKAEGLTRVSAVLQK